MDSMSLPDLHQTPNLNITFRNSSPYCAITIDSHLKQVADVDKLELESLTRRCRAIEHAITKQDVPSSQLTDAELANIERRVDATEYNRRVTPLIITNSSGATEPELVSSLPNSYQHIRNLLWANHNPVYRTALAEWRRQVDLFTARVERKIKRTESRKNEIYNVIGVYSVFQGVLLTATAQSNYLHCCNVGISIALSAFASLCTLVHISRKFKLISSLQKTIRSEEIFLKEAQARIHALENKGEAFRFSEFLEDKRIESSYPQKFHFCGLESRHLMKTTKFINGTDSVITLKEANNGIQRFHFTLQKKGHDEITLDANATYREYHLYVIPSCNAGSLIVSSDHLSDNKVITITEVEGVFSWHGTPRKEPVIRKQKEAEAGNSEGGQAAGTAKNLKRWLSNGFSKLF